MCTTVLELNQNKIEALTNKLFDVLNNGALALMLSIGHRSELFDTLANLPPSTSLQIAENAKLNERYVREWLGAMVTGGIIEFSPEKQTYFLPMEHASLLTRNAILGNFAATSQWIGVLANVEDNVLDSFKNGGGVHYDEFHRFHDVMAEDSSQTVVSGLFEHILPLKPEFIKKLEQGINVLEIGCGQGKALNLLADRFPNSRFTGYDLCDETIAEAKKSSQRLGLSNIFFNKRDITTLKHLEEYNLILAFDVIHDQKDPITVLNNVYNALKSDGLFLMQDIAASSHLEKNMKHPVGPFLYTISTMHCMTVSLAQNGAGLGTVWGEEMAIELLTNSGFSNVKTEKLTHDFLNNYYLCQK